MRVESVMVDLVMVGTAVVRLASCSERFGFQYVHQLTSSFEISERLGAWEPVLWACWSQMEKLSGVLFLDEGS